MLTRSELTYDARLLGCDTVRRTLPLTMIQPDACAGTTTVHSYRPSAG